MLSVLLDLAVQFMILEKYSFSFTLCSMICGGGGGGGGYLSSCTQFLFGRLSL